MKPRLSDLWRWTGTIDRGVYLGWGILLTVLKYNLDRAVLHIHKGPGLWHPWSYWIPGDVFGVLSTSPERNRAAGFLVLVALPFVYTGVVLTLRRLRAIGWPLGWVLLFFVPIVNLLFFSVLAVLPSKLPTPAATPELARRIFIARLVPEGRLGSAVAAILLTALLGLGMVWFFTGRLNSYGWGIFLGVPFFLGLFSTLVYTVHGPRSIAECSAVASLTVSLLSVLLLALAIEGVVCVLMAAPIALILAHVGVLVGRLIVGVRTAGRDTTALLWLLVVLTPSLLAAEASHAPGPEIHSVADEVVLDVPPGEAWNAIKAIDSLTVSKPFLLRIGLPVPVRCTLEREEVGALRTCHFEKGVIEERVLEWDPPRRMRMVIVRSTVPGRHWLGFREAIYELRDEGGQTRLRRTTTYTSTLEPRVYWGALEALGIRSMHAYVLEDLRARFSR